MGIFSKIVNKLKKIDGRPVFQVESIGKVISEAEVVQPYGFTSIAIQDTKCYIQKINPNFEVIIAYEDLQDLGLEAGETALYSTNDKGAIQSTIILKKDNSVVIKSDNVKVESKEAFIKGDKIKLNGDNLGGLIEIEKLKTELAKNNAILQTILTVCSVPVAEAGNGAPSAFQATLNGALAGKQIGNFNNMENKKVVHGR